MIYDIVVIGCGSSAYGFLKGLEKNTNLKNKKIALLCPKDYQSDTKKINIKNISPKFLQNKNLLSLSYYLQTFSNTIVKNFIHIGVHGIGGMARIWGASIGRFSEKDLMLNGIDYNDFIEYYDEVESFLPIIDSENKGSIQISRRIKSLFGKYLNNNFVIKYPNLLIENNCDNCNQCLIGCLKDSIWYPKIADFKDISLDISILNDSYAKKIHKDTVITIDSDNKESTIYSKYTILAGGVMQNYNLLVQLDFINNKKASLLTTPAVAFAFFNFTKNIDKKFFGMGNATFSLQDKDNILFYGNLYDGESLKISEGKVFSSNLFIDKIFKFFSKYMVAGAGFISSNYARCDLDVRDGNIIVNGYLLDQYLTKIYDIKNNLKQIMKDTNSIFAYFKKVKLGADIHYGGGIPYDIYQQDLVKDGNLKGIDNIKVVGGSTFSYLSPVSPTLSYIVNSYRIGKNLKLKEVNDLS
jgi:hypothetical protein